MPMCAASFALSGNTCHWMSVMLDGFSSRITDVQRKEKTKPRPQALNTVEMLRVASSGLGEVLSLGFWIIIIIIIINGIYKAHFRTCHKCAKISSYTLNNNVFSLFLNVVRVNEWCQMISVHQEDCSTHEVHRRQNYDSQKTGTDGSKTTAGACWHRFAVRL